MLKLTGHEKVFVKKIYHISFNELSQKYWSGKILINLWDLPIYNNEYPKTKVKYCNNEIKTDFNNNGLSPKIKKLHV